MEIFSATSSVLTIVFGLGISAGLFMAYFKRDDIGGRMTVVSTSFISATVACLCLSAPLLLASGRLSWLVFQSGEYTFYFVISVLTVVCDTGSAVAFLALRAREKAVQYVILTVVRLVGSIGLGALFVVVLDRGVLGILESQLIGAAFIYCYMVPWLVKSVGLRFSRTDLKEILAFGLPYVPSNMAAWVMFLVDRYFLQFLSTPDELGLYSIGYKFGMVVNALLVGPFLLAWWPFFWSIAKNENARQVYSRVLTYFVLAGVFLALALSVLSREALIAMTTPPFYDAYRVVPLLALSYVLSGCFSIMAVGINLERKTKYVPVVTGVGACANVVLNFVLIPDYGMMGAAIATLLSYLLLPMGMFLVSRRYYRVDYEWGRLGKIVLAAVLVYGASYFIRNGSALVSGVIKLPIVLGFPVLLWLLKFPDPDETQRAKSLARLTMARFAATAAGKGLS